MNAPRSAGQLVGASFALYRRYPWLFLVLAAGVIVPYESIALILTGEGTFGRASESFAVQMPDFVVLWAFVTPLVSSLHVHAVTAVREGREPEAGKVVRRGLIVLPTVAAAAIVSGLGIALGLLALIAPGVILMLRWAVVAQAAAIEHEGWLPALRRSADLTDGNYFHVFIFFTVIGLIASVPVLLAGFAFEGREATAAAVLTGGALNVIAASFAALATAVFYYDLVARWNAISAPAAGRAPGSWDPMAYSDAARPKGWYVNPSDPKKMSHWGGPELPEWNGTARTPRKIRRAWETEND